MVIRWLILLELIRIFKKRMMRLEVINLIIIIII
jgi:hypothetical protein